MQGLVFSKHFEGGGSFLFGLETLAQAFQPHLGTSLVPHPLQGLQNLRTNGRSQEEIVRSCVKLLSAQAYLHPSSEGFCITYSKGLAFYTPQDVSFGWREEHGGAFVFWVLFSDSCLISPDDAFHQIVSRDGWEMECGDFSPEGYFGCDMPALLAVLPESTF